MLYFISIFCVCFLKYYFSLLLYDTILVSKILRLCETRHKFSLACCNIVIALACIRFPANINNLIKCLTRAISKRFFPKTYRVVHQFTKYGLFIHSLGNNSSLCSNKIVPIIQSPSITVF